MTDEQRPDRTNDGSGRRASERSGERRPSVRRPRRARRRRPLRWIIGLGVVVIAGAGIWAFLQRDGDDASLDFGDLDGDADHASPVAGDRAVVLAFPEWDATGFVTEQRQIASRDRPGEDLLGLMAVLCEGPRISGAVSAMPRGTRALAAFVDPENSSVVVDFSQELVTAHPGGSTAEVATLTSILRTVALNFPETRRCIILVEGAQVETLAGHLDMVQPFDPRRWL